MLYINNILCNLQSNYHWIIELAEALFCVGFFLFLATGFLFAVGFLFFRRAFLSRFCDLGIYALRIKTPVPGWTSPVLQIPLQGV